MSLRQQNKIRARQQIIAAAEALISEDGAANTTTRAIAKQAGVSYQTLYNYFPNKAALMRELLQEEFALWSRQVDGVLKAYDGDLIGSLLAICELGIDILSGPKAELWNAITQQLLAEPPDHTQYSALSTVAHEHCYALLNSALGMGQLRPDTDLHLMAHTLFSLCDYNLLMFHFMPIAKDQFLHTQRQQFELVLNPYLT